MPRTSLLRPDRSAQRVDKHIGQTSGAARRRGWLGTTPLGLEVALLKVS